MFRFREKNTPLFQGTSRHPKYVWSSEKKEYCIFFSQCIIIMYNKTSKSNRVSAHLHQPQNYLQGLGLDTGIIFISHTHIHPNWGGTNQQAYKNISELFCICLFWITFYFMISSSVHSSKRNLYNWSKLFENCFNQLFHKDCLFRIRV